MKIQQFDRLGLMTTRVVFQPENIKPGSVIRVYKVKRDDVNVQFVTKGIITGIDPLMIKYSYYSKSSGGMETTWLYASDIYEEGSDAQWVSNEVTYIFKIEEGE